MSHRNRCKIRIFFSCLSAVIAASFCLSILAAPTNAAAYPPITKPVTTKPAVQANAQSDSKSISTGIVVVTVVVIVVFFITTSGSSDNKPKNTPPKRPSNPSQPNKTASKSPNQPPAKESPKVDTRKISAEVKKVMGCIGISEAADVTPIKKMLAEKKTKSAIMAIAEHLSLGDLNISVTRKATVKKDDKNPSRNILADVDVSDVGAFGTTHFKYRTCRINIYPGSENDPDTFITVIAHELCHIILHSTKTPEKETNDEERLTDLAVIFSGFSDAYKASSGVGYLNDDETSLACSFYSFELDDAREYRAGLQKEYDEITNKNSDKIKFINMVARFLKNKNQKLNPEDVSRIGICVSSINKQQAKQIVDSVKEIKGYLKTKRYKSDRSSKEKIKLLKQALNSISIPDYEYVAILSKYT